MITCSTPGKILSVGIIMLSLVAPGDLYAQKTNYSQFWNEFAFTRSIKGSWATELNLGQTWTSSPANKSMFSTNSQFYVRGWLHYYASPRWKVSFFYAYYYNKDVPEISQEKLPELRSAFQGIYYIKKIGYTLSTRIRLEDRQIRDTAGIFEASYRLRNQLKLVYPFNGKTIRKGVVYGIASDELFFKSSAKLTGLQFFDRNRLTIGGGYSLTDDMQVEITYANEYLPRDGGNEVYNALQVNFGFNNFISNLKEKLFNKHEPEKDE